jgi:hydrogenase maturation protease
MPPAVLVIGIGNPSRGDDAIGPWLIERLEALNLPDVELLTDFQLQIDYAWDMRERAEVIVIDAAVSGPEPFAFLPITPTEDASYTSHALSPSALLHGFVRLYGEPPPTYALAVRGYAFTLGEPLHEKAAANLAAAFRFLTDRLSRPR